MPYTSAHWGCYEVRQNGGTRDLIPLASDALPSDIGAGWLSGAMDRGVRVARPSVRKGWLERRDTTGRGQDAFVEVSWDEALDLVVGELTRVRVEHGNGAIFAGSYGWASAGRFHHAQSQLRRFMNLAGGYTGGCTTYSHAAAEILFPYITGLSNTHLQEEMTSWPALANHCELLLSFGGISGRTAQVASAGTSAHEVPIWLGRATKAGMKVIGVSPIKGDLEDMPDADWIPIRPGTDTAMLLALAYEIRAADAHDSGFLQRCTTGWETFNAYLGGAADGVRKTADWAAPICDLPAGLIRDIATKLSRHRSMISIAWGVQRADHGEQPIWAALNLAAMLGQIGQPGTGFGFGYGSVTPVGRPKRFLPWPSLPQGCNPIDQVIPVARIADALLHPGVHYLFDGKDCTYPDLRMIYWAGGNPFHHHQDLFRLEQAWARPETIVVHEHSWTATARRADIVLPATTPLERADIMMNKRDPVLVYMTPVTARQGQAMNDHMIFRALAARLGFEEQFTEGRSEADWLAWLWQGARKVARDAGVDLPDYDMFKKQGLFELPQANTTRVLFSGFTRDPASNPLPTDSGKLELACARIGDLDLPDCPGHPAWFPPIEGAAEVAVGGLHLISPQPRSRLHAQLDTGAVSMGSKVAGREPCTLHPDTAAQHGIAAGDVVLIENVRGACLAGAVLKSGIRRDCIALATGAWFDPQDVGGRVIDVHGNPNVLTIDKGASALSQGNIAHTAVVRVSRWDGPVPDVATRGQPTFAPRAENKEY